MAKHPRLQLRGHIYYFRCRVPGDLLAHYGKAVITYSFGTKDGSTAVKLVRQASAQQDELLPVSRTLPLSRHCGSLELHRAEIANGRVTPARIVETLNVIEHISPSLISRPVDLAGNPLGFQR